MKLSRRNFVKFLGCSAAMLALPNVSAMAVSKTTIGAPAEMVDVLVTEDTAHLIYASVPKSLAGEYTIVQNMNSEYPKVWRVFERIS